MVASKTAQSSAMSRLEEREAEDTSSGETSFETSFGSDTSFSHTHGGDVVDYDRHKKNICAGGADEKVLLIHSASS
jgi:hypothetical protein